MVPLLLIAAVLAQSGGHGSFAVAGMNQINPVSQNDESISTAQKERRSRIDAGMRDIREIDAELAGLREGADRLRSSAAVRIEQVRSLRLRYPTISLNDGASADAIYQALVKVRREKAAALLPTVQAAQTDTLQKLCLSIVEMETARAEVERSDDYLKLTFADRMKWRSNFDEFISSARADRQCPGR